ncbi:MAG: response regulator [bacterium]
MSKILIVEDELNTRLGLSEILIEEGYQVNSAEDGAGALEKMDPSIDLLLTDLRLPDISGIELHKKLKGSYPELVTVVMTAYSTLNLYQEAQDAGIISWLTKPLNVDMLLSILRNALQGAELSKRKENQMIN